MEEINVLVCLLADDHAAVERALGKVVASSFPSARILDPTQPPHEGILYIVALPVELLSNLGIQRLRAELAAELDRQGVLHGGLRVELE